MSFNEKKSLKYPDEAPRDYGISEMQYTFDFICLVLKRDSSIDKAIGDVANKYGLSESFLKDYLAENKYILSKANADELSERLKKHNTKSLKRILKSHGLKTSGKRERIERRILENNLLGGEYHLSSKSKVFYKNKKRRIRIFNDYLSKHYYFREFNEFYMDNYRKKEARIPVEFINLHIRKAVEEKNHLNYLFNNRVMADHYLKMESPRKMLEFVLKNYCMNLNPVWKIGELEGHFAITLETYENLISLRDILGKNAIINTYYLIWDSFNFEKIIVSKYDGYRCLKDMLNIKDYNKINMDLSKRFYSNDDLKIKTITQKTLFDF